MSTHASSSGITQAALAVERAVGELRAGRPVAVSGADGTYLMLAAETAGDNALALLTALAKDAPLYLALGAPRARALGLTKTAGQPLKIAAPRASVQALLRLADPLEHIAAPLADITAEPLGDAGRAGLKLAGHGVLLPAVLLATAPASAQQNPAWAQGQGLLHVWADEVAIYPEAMVATLAPASEATITLPQGAARAVAFRSRFGSAEHLAIIVGAPEKDAAPLVRIHSSCLTGDIIGSLRCDCRDQLHLALEAVHAAGSGIILYLDQEGRGIGLANKLRAYRLQDEGADTVDANEALGFAADERDFRVAAEMLRQLGIRKVRLLTNNPEKMAALQERGVEVAERVTLAAEPTEHNRRYLATKAARCGHLF